MDIFALDWIPLLITGIGTLLLIGEVLVNMRGLFGLIGLVFIVVYFSAYLDPGMFIIMFIIYFVGLLLIIIDGKVVNDGTLSTLGVAAMLTAVALAAPNLFAGLYAIIGVLVGGAGSFALLKVFKPRSMWGKLALTDRLTNEAGYNSMNEEYELLVDKAGITLTDLRPVGTVRIDDKDYSAISNAQWIEKDTEIHVTQVDGTRILVEEVITDESN